jgi:ABC-type lipoprotein release transport system permease subunit
MDLRFTPGSLLKLPITKKIAVGFAALIVFAALLYGFKLGFNELLDYLVTKRFYRQEKKRFEQIKKYEAEAAELKKEVEKHIHNEQKLATENAVLRHQNELTAEILRNNDAQLKGDAEKLAQILKNKLEKINEIENLDDFNANVCALCADVRASGFRLSAEFCGNCPNR